MNYTKLTRGWTQVVKEFFEIWIGYAMFCKDVGAVGAGCTGQVPIT